MSESYIGSLLRRTQRSAESRRRAPRGRRAMRSPWIEALEDRALLTTVQVDLVNFAFAPNAVTIHVGDTVEWVWQSPNHSTTSVQGSAISWDSGVLNTGATFDQTFNAAGTFNYYCKIHGFDNHNGTAGGMSGTITVVPAATISSIMLMPANPSVNVGGTEQFMAMAMFSDGTSEDITSQSNWTSSNTGAVTVSNAAGFQGLATAVAPGTSTITATMGSLSGSTSMTVNAALASIALTPANPNVPNGETEQFIATGTLTDGTTINLTNVVTWASSSTSIATISNTPGSNGLATGQGTGNATITATDQGISGSTSLNVTAPVLVSITVGPSSTTIVQGSTEQLTVIGTLSDHSTENLTGVANWASTVPSVASVSTTGVAGGLAAGTSSIVASVNGFSSAVNLTVQPPLVTAMTIIPIIKKHKLTQIEVFFSGVVNPAEVKATSLYALVTPGKKNSFTAKNAGKIKVKTAKFVPSANEVILTPKTAIAATTPVQLTIKGTLQDSLGRLIDGDKNGQPGGNVVAVIRKTLVTFS
jgi:trimeric autotransporter adhesin